ncbi:hypothetical protein I315_03055 [Cryptococcus gattii Ru294]|nr:hypothetical protein I315_03055 [Cryptococcus gattii Ru294]
MFFPGKYTARAVKLELISSELLIPNMDARHSWMVVRSDPEHDDSLEGPFFLSLASLQSNLSTVNNNVFWSRQVL